MDNCVDIIISIPVNDKQSFIELLKLCKKQSIHYEVAECCDYHEDNYSQYQKLLSIIPASDSNYSLLPVSDIESDYHENNYSILPVSDSESESEMKGSCM